MKHILHSAFTLVELMIVVAIIAILAALAIPNFIGYQRSSHAKTCEANMRIIRDACMTYQVNHGTVTTELEDLFGGDGTHGLLKSDIACPIGGKYKIKYDNKTQEFTITCSAADSETHVVSGADE